MPSIPQSVLNNTLWTLSLVLQITLVAAIFSRNIARKLPAFTALITFYPLRAACLFALYGHLPPDFYASLNTSFSLLDLLLQAAVAIELTLALIRERGGWTLPRALLALLAVVASSTATTLAIAQLPPHIPLPIDRAQTFLYFLLLALFLWIVTTPASNIQHSSQPRPNQPGLNLLRPVALGLALYASISLAAQVGRTVAAIHRDAQAYARWSYTSAAGYLLVVALWLLTLKLQPEPESNPQPSEPTPQEPVQSLLDSH